MAIQPSRSPIRGVEVWKNPKNKFAIFQLHYEANPKKRTAEYKELVRSSMPRAQYMQEYELQWDSFEGMPVYPDFSEAAHVHRGLEPWVGLPIIRGWDFGLMPCCIIGQLQEDTLVIFREYIGLNMGAERFSSIMLPKFNLQYPGWSDPKKHCYDFIDPAGLNRAETDEGTCAKILDSKGLNVIAGAIAWEERRQAVEKYLLTRNRKGACLKIDKDHCKVLIQGFKGGYHYPEKAADIQPTKLRPVKNSFSHPHDGFQMLATGLQKIAKQHSGSKIAPLSYSWQNAT